MAFCMKCGNEIAEDAAFCAKCGTPAGEAAAKKPEKEKVGNIHKCPSCGAVVLALTAKCPECGHEFRNVGVSSGIKEFFEKLASSDVEAKAEPAGKKNNIKGDLKFFAILVVVLLILYPILIELFELNSDLVIAIDVVVAVSAAAAIFVKKVSFSENENRRKRLIETFPVPNAKEDLIEFLVLASSQIMPAAGFSHAARKQQQWNKIWAVKCSQVYLKTNVLFAADKDSQAIVDDIRKKNDSQIRAAQRVKIITVSAAAAAIIACIAGINLKRSGSDIFIPESVSIGPENVEFKGVLSEYLKAAGKGVTITWDDKNLQLKMTLELENSLADVDKYIEQRATEEIQKLAKQKKWEVKYCTYEAPWPVLLIHGEESHFSNAFGLGWDSKEYFKEISKLKPGAARTITVINYKPDEKRSETRAELKKGIQQFVTPKEMVLDLRVSASIKYTPPSKAPLYDVEKISL